MRTREILGRVFTMNGSMYARTGGMRFDEAYQQVVLDCRDPFLVVDIIKLPQSRVRILQVLSRGKMHWITFDRAGDSKLLRPVQEATDAA